MYVSNALTIDKLNYSTIKTLISEYTLQYVSLGRGITVSEMFDNVFCNILCLVKIMLFSSV